MSSPEPAFHALAPLRATVAVWALWAVSWFVAALWSRRTVARPKGIEGFAHYLPTLLGAAMLFALRAGHRFWHLASSIGWVLCAATVASFAFAWWARLSLGSLWSGAVTRKMDHHVVDTGPYRLVRHPIYTGLIAAGFLLAVEIGTGLAVAGASIMTLGWWMKARVEERFLAQELGVAYDAYRRRTPMLVPFLRP